MPNSYQSIRWLARAAVAGVLCAGCSAEVEPPPEASVRDYDDVALAIAASTMNGSAGGMAETLYDAAKLATGAPGGVIYARDADSFHGTRAGLQYEYTVHCTDGDGAAMDACSSSAESARVRADFEGEVETFGMRAVLEHEAELSLADLTTGEITFSGSGDFTVDAHMLAAGSDRAFSLGYSAVYDDVQVSRSALEIHGGRIELVIDARRSVQTSDGAESPDKAFRIAGDLRFAEDGSAMLTLGEQHYTIDLETGLLAKFD